MTVPVVLPDLPPLPVLPPLGDPPGMPRRLGPTYTGHTCPTCTGPVGSLLALCWQPACITAYLDHDALFDNQDQ
ncbi:hypothetical protein [Micromonospora carbonacea]|uniref:hypothetical protein n=1 Tax=Micromonospora carbonacea TaxID=47853 RepID=UPI0037150F77